MLFIIIIIIIITIIITTTIMISLIIIVLNLNKHTHECVNLLVMAFKCRRRANTAISVLLTSCDIEMHI